LSSSTQGLPAQPCQFSGLHSGQATPVLCTSTLAVAINMRDITVRRLLVWRFPARDLAGMTGRYGTVDNRPAGMQTGRIFDDNLEDRGDGRGSQWALRCSRSERNGPADQ
jgi:hypothetical protein